MDVLRAPVRADYPTRAGAPPEGWPLKGSQSMMNWITAAAEWRNFRGVVRANWRNLTDVDLAGISGPPRHPHAGATAYPALRRGSRSMLSKLAVSTFPP